VLTKSFYVTCVDARTLRKLTSFARFGDGNGKKSTSLLPCLAAVTGSPDPDESPCKYPEVLQAYVHSETIGEHDANTRKTSTRTAQSTRTTRTTPIQPTPTPTRH
jgi:hypothetical protein